MGRLDAEESPDKFEYEDLEEVRRSRLRKFSFLMTICWSFTGLVKFDCADGMWDQVGASGYLLVAAGWFGFLGRAPKISVPSTLVVMAGGILVGLSARHDVRGGVIGALGLRGVGGFLIAAVAGYMIVRHLVTGSRDPQV